MRVKKGLTPFVILLVICGVWSSGETGEITVAPTDSDKVIADGEISVDSSSVLRYIRAANGDKMSVAVDQMQKVARLTTGISLQLGLLSGQIQADPLISELLRLGNVTPSEIVALDAGKLTEAMGQIRELPNTLVNSKGIEEIEAKLEKIEEVRKLVKSSGDGKTWVGRKEFLDDVDFVTKKMNLTAIELVNTKISVWNHNKKQIIDTTQFDEASLTLAGSSFTSLKVLTDQIKESIGNIGKMDGSGWKYPKMKSAVESLGPLKTITEAVKTTYDSFDAVEKAVTNEQKVFDSSKRNIETLSKLSSSLSKVVPDLKKVENIVRSRGSPKKKGLEYPGFLNGFWDIDNLIDDLGDDWMAKVVRVRSMALSLEPLKSLFRLFRKIDSYFGMYENERTVGISRYMEHVKDIQTVPADSSAINAAVDGFWKCKQWFTSLDQPSDADLQAFIKLAEELDENMKKLLTNIDAFKTMVNAAETGALLTNFKNLVTTGKTPDLQALIGKFKKSKEVKDLSALFGHVQTACSDVETFSKEASASADKIINSTGKVDAYLNSLQKYQPLFKCLHGLDDETSKLVVEGAKISQKFRNAEHDNGVVTDGEEVIKGVVGSIKGFKTLKAAIGKAKNQKVKNLDALKALSEPVKQSKVIGAAVRGVSAMKEALEKKDQADVITLNSGVVEAQMKLVKLEQADVNNLNSVVQLKGPLATMYQKLDVWKKGVSEASAKGLGNSSSMFFAAKTVPGVTGDLGAMAKSVGVLIKAVTDNSARKKLASVKKALESLDTLGLDFASYSTQFDASKNSLTALDLFYANYTARVESTLPFSKACLQKKQPPTDVCNDCDPCKIIHDGWFARYSFVIPIFCMMFILSAFLTWFLEKATKKWEKEDAEAKEGNGKETSGNTANRQSTENEKGISGDTTNGQSSEV